jgi:hypothetical protein
MPESNSTPDPIKMMPEVRVTMINFADDGVTPIPVGEPGKSEVQQVVMMPEIVCEMINAPLPPDRSR